MLSAAVAGSVRVESSAWRVQTIRALDGVLGGMVGQGGGVRLPTPHRHLRVRRASGRHPQQGHEPDDPLIAALRSADLAPSAWLEPGDLAVILRSAYNPDVAAALERHGDLGRDLAIAGHGILRTTGLIAVSGPDPEDLERAVSIIEQAAIQVSCETRRLWGQQAQGFAAAALPLCRTR